MFEKEILSIPRVAYYQVFSDFWTPGNSRNGLAGDLGPLPARVKGGMWPRVQSSG